MLRTTFIIFLLAIFFSLISTHTFAEKDSGGNSKYLEEFRAADGIRASVWHGSNANDPIASKLDECILDHNDTIGMEDCLGQAYNSYENLLNNILKSSGGFGSNPLKSSGFGSENQKNWLALQKSDRDMTKNYGKNNNVGTIWGVILGWHQVSMIRERISEIAFYLGGGQE